MTTMYFLKCFEEINSQNVKQVITQKETCSYTIMVNLLAKSFGFDFSSKKIRPKIELAGNTKYTTRSD